MPGKSHGQRSLVGYCPWGRKESDMTERLHFHFRSRYENNLCGHWWMNGQRKCDIIHTQTHTHIHVHTYIYTYIMECYSTLKKNEILPFVTWTDLESTVLSEVSQRKKTTVWSHLHVEFKKQATKKKKKKTSKQADRYRQQTGGCQR